MYFYYHKKYVFMMTCLPGQVISHNQEEGDARQTQWGIYDT